MNAIADLGIVIAAGGSSSRYGAENKLFEKLAGVPVFIHCLRNFLPVCRKDALVLVAPGNDIPAFEQLLNDNLSEASVKCVAGGDTRSQSVCNGLAVLPAGVEYVAVHDAARPLASAELLLMCLTEARKYDGALAAHPVADTLKKGSADDVIETTVDRSSLWAVETPQIFPLDKLQLAYEKARQTGGEFTDDAGVMESAGYRVKLVRNPDNNLKITYPKDIALAEALLRK